MASVAIDNVRKAYGSVQVVHGIDLDIPDGAFVVLLGPSGCGKSTLLRMIAGLESVTSGDIRIGERNVTHMIPKDRDIAMVFQNYALYPHMSVADNMSFALKRAGVAKAEIATRVDRAAQILGLETFLERLPRQLSGGQRQRVAMGRALVRDPAVFLFDEPLSNLDAKLRVQMRVEIKELHQRLKTTTVYVTHDQIEAMTMADKIVILRDGRIEQAGHPLDVYDRPINLFVAGFIGSPAMNVVSGTIEGDEGRPVLRAEGVSLPLPPTPKLKRGQAITYGIRPEHLKPVDHPTDLQGIIMAVEPTGPETHVYVKFGPREFCAITQDRLKVKPGERVSLAPVVDRVHVFNSETGLRIDAFDVVILGAGVMGSAMALPAAHKGAGVALVGTHLDRDIVDAVAAGHPHPRLKVALPASVTAHPVEAFGEQMRDPPRLLILGVASAGVDWAIDRLVKTLTAPVPVLMITKGLAPAGDRIAVLPHRVAEEVRRRTGIALPVMAVGGPCIAGELAAGRDTSVVVTGAEADVRQALACLEAPFYHARVQADVVGVEICAAFKNFYALAVGAVAGLQEVQGVIPNGAQMFNLASSLFAQALREMAVLVTASGGAAASVYDLAGVGDLYVTCQAGRNSRMGRLLGLGLPYSGAKAEHMADDTVEGAQLALDLGPTLEAMMEAGTLPADRLPLTRTILDAVCRDRPFTLEFARYHRA